LFTMRAAVNAAVSAPPAQYFLLYSKMSAPNSAGISAMVIILV